MIDPPPPHTRSRALVLLTSSMDSMITVSASMYTTLLYCVSPHTRTDVYPSMLAALRMTHEGEREQARHCWSFSRPSTTHALALQWRLVSKRLPVAAWYRYECNGDPYRDSRLNLWTAAWCRLSGMQIRSQHASVQTALRGSRANKTWYSKQRIHATTNTLA